jgi:hypothetical protein
MYKYTPVLLLFIPLLRNIHAFRERKNEIHLEDKWTGTVSFFEKKSGGEIGISEWKMEATITNGTGTAVHTSMTRSPYGDHSFCRTSAKTELDLGIDDEAGEYSINVPVPGCYGTVTDRYGKTDSMAVTDETAIIIDHQKLPKNRSVLSGMKKTIDGPDAGGVTTVTTYEWNLKKTN